MNTIAWRNTVWLGLAALALSTGALRAEKMDPVTGSITVDCGTSEDRTCLECGYSGSDAQACCRRPDKCEVKNKVPPIVALESRASHVDVAVAQPAQPATPPLRGPHATGTLLVAEQPGDVMLQKLPFIRLVAEDDRVRVLRYAPAVGDHSAMHSHPKSVVVVLRGGRVRITLPDGTQSVVTLKAGDAMIRPAVVHYDEALDPVETILVELK